MQGASEIALALASIRTLPRARIDGQPLVRTNGLEG